MSNDDTATTVQGTGVLTIPAAAMHEPANDTLTVRLVVIGLILVAISIIVASTILAFDDRELPSTLVALGGVAVGALSGLLASTASRRT